MTGNLAERLAAGRDRAVAWLSAQVSASGVPAGSDRKPGWGRLPWALALSGQGALASSVVAWADREAVGGDGGFIDGPALGSGTMTAYGLSHLAIGAWLVERYDVAGRIMAKLETMMHLETGGVDTGLTDADGVAMQDLLMTAQVGFAALVTGRTLVAARARAWVDALLRDQPDYPHRLYTFRAGSRLVTDPTDRIKWLGLCEFQSPRQAYYTPGIAAAFLAGVAMQSADASALETAEAYLEMNRRGTRDQFEDLASVQLCKFGWGSALVVLARAGAGPVGDVETMGQWFLDRQGADGSWAPSAFLVPDPDISDRIMKTAEHVMEVNAILAALGAAAARNGRPAE
ncbi:hypothetical protein [Sphingopyxis sp.]|uniref:hypothetical protein n=1 Tax=Sphingopyxis sp. TaxID=1908224 RepID=UPI003D6D14D0